jgi:uncharacterized protein YbjT (DUF2867 family)
VAVIGAGGGVGHACLKLLLKLGVRVRAVVRDPAKYQYRFFGRAEVVPGDVRDQQALEKALQGCAAVIYAASSKDFWGAEDVDHRGVERTAAAALACGCLRIVLVSSMYVNKEKYRFKPLRVMLNHVRWGMMDAKFRGEEALRASGIDYCIVRPGGLDHGNIPGTADHVCVLPKDSESVPAGSRSVWRADVAAVCVAAVSDPSSSRTTVEVVARARTGADPPFSKRQLFAGIEPDPPRRLPLVVLGKAVLGPPVRKINQTGLKELQALALQNSIEPEDSFLFVEM